jgi:hypothetical protein
MAERIAERRYVEAAAAERTIVERHRGPELSSAGLETELLAGTNPSSDSPLQTLVTRPAFASVECNIACRYSGRAGGQHMISTAYGR